MMGKGGWRGVGVRLGTMRGLRVCSGGLQCFPLERESVEREEGRVVRDERGECGSHTID